MRAAPGHRAPARTGPRRGDGAGFSLLELLVVVALLGIITAAIVPMYGSSMNAIQLRNARNDFISLIVFIQQRAVSDGREYRIYIDQDEGAYWVEAHVASELAEKIFEPIVEPLAGRDYGQRRHFPDRIELTRFSRSTRKDRDRDAHYIACYPNGASDNVVMHFRDTRGREGDFRIITHGAMGRVEVEER